MILTPLCRPYIQPIFNAIKLTRNMRPTIKLGREKFQITIDVRQFKKDEIRVKAHTEYVIIEGKQEKKTKQGSVIRQFVRKFRLPEGCTPENMESKLSSDGVLTITARRKISESDIPSETLIPISLAEEEDKDASVVIVKSKNICDNVKDKSEDKKP